VVYSQESSFTAAECCRYLELITGAALPMMPAGKEPAGPCLFVGDERLADAKSLRPGKLPENGFRIGVRGNSAFIIGTDKLATLHGVYSFLEKCCGCHWTAPGDANETVPRRNSISIESPDYMASPGLPLRGMNLGGRLWKGGRDIEQLDWMARNKMNFCAMGEIDYWPEYREHAVREIKEKRGMTLMVGCHTWTHFLNPNQYFKKHPEYYALVRGKRLNPMTPGSGGAMVCLTHPDVPRIMEENVIMFLSQNPEVDILGLSQNDGNNWCECPRCACLEPLVGRRFSPIVPVKTRSNLFLINKIVERVVKVFPNKRFAAMAYSHTLEPPDIPGFRLHPNLDLIIALYERAYDRPLGKGLEPADWRTMHFDFLPTRYTLYPEILRRWRRIVQGRIYFHKYYMAKNGSCCLPWPIHTTIVEDLKLFRRLGLDGFYAQYPTWPRYRHDYPEKIEGNFGVYGLNYYLAARAGYDVSTSAPDILKEYCRYHYGPAAKPMIEYHSILDKASQRLHLFATPNDQIQIFFPGLIKYGRSLLKKALKMAGTRRFKGNVRSVWCSFHYASSMASIRDDLLEILRKYMPESKIAATQRLMRRIAQNEKRLVRFIKRNMRGEGLFDYVQNDAKPLIVNDEFIHSIKKGAYFINAQSMRCDMKDPNRKLKK